MPSFDQIDVYLEVGERNIFAGAIDWPGWSRSGRDESAALQSLFVYSPRYARVLTATQLKFLPPQSVSDFSVVERLKGSSTTDFGAPDAAPSTEAKPVDEADLQRFQAILQACWQAFDNAVQSASGKELRKGPRGGGRDLDKITQHVLGSNAAYLSMLGKKFEIIGERTPLEELARNRSATLDALASAAQGELPTRGPRGGARWTPRYFVRRAAWHILDHAWEIEDRLL